MLGLLRAFRRGVESTLLTMVLVPLVFGVIYVLLGGASKTSLEIHRVRVSWGQAGLARRSERLYTTFSATGPTSVGLGQWLEGRASPFELEPHRWCPGASFEVRRPLVLGPRGDGWDGRLDLRAFESRTVVQDTPVVDGGTLEGPDLRLNVAAARWEGRLTSRLDRPLAEAHLVWGWHHQALGRLEPGQTVAIAMPLVDLEPEQFCAACQVRHPAHPASCPSCEDEHPVAGAVGRLRNDVHPTNLWLDAVLTREASRLPDCAGVPLVVGFEAVRSRDAAGARISESRIVISVLSVDLEALHGTIPWNASISSSLNVGRCLLADEPSPVGCRYPATWRCEDEPEVGAVSRLVIPARGRVAGMKLGLATARGTASARPVKLELWNVRKKVFETFSEPRWDGLDLLCAGFSGLLARRWKGWAASALSQFGPLVLLVAGAIRQSFGIEGRGPYLELLSLAAGIDKEIRTPTPNLHIQVAQSGAILLGMFVGLVVLGWWLERRRARRLADVS